MAISGILIKGIFTYWHNQWSLFSNYFIFSWRPPLHWWKFINRPHGIKHIHLLNFMKAAGLLQIPLLLLLSKCLELDIPCQINLRNNTGWKKVMVVGREMALTVVGPRKSTRSPICNRVQFFCHDTHAGAVVSLLPGTLGPILSEEAAVARLWLWQCPLPKVK